MAWLIWEFTDTFKDIVLLLQAYVLGCYVSIISLFTSFFQIDYLQQIGVVRYTGGGLNPNDLALVLAIGIPAAYYLATSGVIKRRTLRWVYWLFCPVAVITVLMTASRGGFMAMSIGILFLIATYSKGGLKVKVGLVAISIIALILAWKLVPEANLLRLMDVGGELRFGRWSSRRDILEAGLRVFWESPIIGMGSGTFISAVGITADWQVAHNAFLGVLVEGGIIGFLLFVSMPILAAVSALRMPARERFLWLGILLTWGVGVLSLSWEYRKVTWFILGLLVSHSVNLKQQLRYVRQNVSMHMIHMSSFGTRDK
jgi:O-antigen ligase